MYSFPLYLAPVSLFQSTFFLSSAETCPVNFARLILSFCLPLPSNFGRLTDSSQFTICKYVHNSSCFCSIYFSTHINLISSRSILWYLTISFLATALTLLRYIISIAFYLALFCCTTKQDDVDDNDIDFGAK